MDIKSQNAIKKLADIKTYCKTYHTWPKEYKSPQNDQEKLSNRLQDWLTKSYYNSTTHLFVFTNLKLPSGKLLIIALDELYDSYCTYHNTHQKSLYIQKKISDITELCDEFQTWPYSYPNPESDFEITSTICAHWLINSKYYTKEFKYHSHKLKNGSNIKNLLDELYEKYFYTSKDTMRIKNMLEKLISYCTTYEVWPKIESEPQTTQEKFASFLISELKFYESNFPLFENTNLPSIINYYRSNYSRISKDYEPLITTLVTYFLKLSEVMYTNFAEYNSYRASIIGIIKDHNLNLNFQEIALILTNQEREVVELLSAKITTYLRETPEKYFYQSLLNHFLGFAYQHPSFLTK